MKRISIITTILIVLSIITGFIQHSKITKSCTQHVEYVNQINKTTGYTFDQCYGMQTETYIIFGLLHFITFISIIIFMIKLFSYGISHTLKKIKSNY